jgi:hypothetical protein
MTQQVLQGDRGSLEDRLDTAAWGLLAVLVGVFALPGGPVTDGLAIATGAGLLGINAVRRSAGLPIRWFSSVLGAVVILAGAAALAGSHIDVFAAFFIALGVVTVVAAIARRN